MAAVLDLDASLLSKLCVDWCKDFRIPESPLLCTGENE